METQTRKPMITGWMRVAVIALVVLAVLVAVGLWARSSSGATAPPQPGAMMQTNEDGQITIKAIWQGRNAGPVFAIEMDTHVVNLDGYDLFDPPQLVDSGARATAPGASRMVAGVLSLRLAA